MSISVVKDPEVLKLVHALGFKGNVLLDTTEKGIIAFLSDNCYMCDEPWTVKVSTSEKPDDKDQITIYVCDAHLKRVQDKATRTIHIILRRVIIE